MEIKGGQQNQTSGRSNIREFLSKLFRSFFELPKQLVKLAIRIYQKLFSFDHAFWANPDKMRICVHYPSCSAYTYEAVDKFGAIQGSIMGIFRILRCHQFTKHRLDPVPNHFSIWANLESKSESEEES